MTSRCLAFHLALVCLAAGSDKRPWQTLEYCRLVVNQSNDGDSFHVRYRNSEFIFRLYFVDCPEVDTRFPGRVDEQAQYFDINHRDALMVGRAAAEFSMRVLAQKFTVRTRWTDAHGDSRTRRSYCSVEVGGHDLAEMLVSRGLARIHGAVPEGAAAEQLNTLLKRENEARENQLGAWGLKH